MEAHRPEPEEHWHNRQFDSLREQELNLHDVRRSCSNCKYLNIKQPTFDQPYTECWCDRGCFDAYEGGGDLEEEIDCPFFNYA